MSSQTENNQIVLEKGSPARLLSTLVVGLLLGASLGPALYLAVGRLELSGDLLLSFAIGAFLSLGLCLVVAGVATLLIVPRVFASARGTLAGMVSDLTQASRAHARGNSDEAIQFVGRAVEEGVAWYSIGATRRFVAQAALGLLISFGGVIGAVLLFSQNTLLREQTGLLKQQNEKIDQQTMVADAQKRGAFATELFSIVQEVAKLPKSEEQAGLPKDLLARIIVLTSSATPYAYLDFKNDAVGGTPKQISKPLSPERGLIIAALIRMKVNLPSLHDSGAIFAQADLRGADLRNVNLSEIDFRGSDFTGATVSGANFKNANLSGVELSNVEARDTSFIEATIRSSVIKNGDFLGAKFIDTKLRDLKFEGGSIEAASFEKANLDSTEFVNVSVGRRTDNFPSGLDWPKSVQDQLIEAVTLDRLEPALLNYVPPDRAVKRWRPPAPNTPEGTDHGVETK
ncbi:MULTISPECIES: pentapeptide repeat-containing protein [Bradyrhizobium]|uniref:pentapeptide repeat-containing protein n=1 Tax=Bradyrhizobium elkanii TaxID=29448 RepID=UPI000414A740|nr:pentapeptide repeat-containing protein [Bradyrhizobium elkanii]